MSITLHLGVVDLPYSYPDRRQKRKAAANTTTGDVANLLEAKYHIMELFFEENRQTIADDLANSMAGAFETLVMRNAPPGDPYAMATSDIETMFRKFIESEGMAGLGMPGVPTKAALAGVSHRLKHPYAKANPRRPSFRDTGLYESSMKAWID